MNYKLDFFVGINIFFVIFVNIVLRFGKVFYIFRDGNDVDVTRVLEIDYFY